MQARGPDALSLGRETGVMHRKATAELFCWTLKVLGRKREPGCCCIPSPGKPDLLERAETLMELV